MSSKIGISWSECEDMGRYGIGIMHLQDTLVEVARALLVNGYTLVFGGDLNYHGHFNFTELLLQLAQTFGGVQDRIKNYSAFPLHVKISAKREAEVMRVAQIIRITPEGYAQWHGKRYEELTVSERNTIDEIFECSKAEHQAIWAASLTDMRKRMTNDIQCRIITGGRLTGFKGRMPGVIEEAMLCIRNDVTVFIDGRFGGAAQEMVKGALARISSPLGFDFTQLVDSKVTLLSKDVIVVRGKESFPDLEKYFKIS